MIPSPSPSGCRAALLCLVALVACQAPLPVSPDAARVAAPAADALTFAFWNVENLFDCEDDPANPGDDEYGAAEGWTPERYATKRSHLAGAIAAVAPHVLGVAEIENRRVLEDLIAAPELAGLGYRIAHVDSPDKRGIDVALLYRAPFAARGGDVATALHAIEQPGQPPTRGVLEVRLEVDGEPLTVLVNHWPSRGGDRDGAFRRVAGRVARELVDRITADAQAMGREADVLLLGDFNDDPFDASIVEALGAVRSRNAVQNRSDVRLLYNPSWSLLAESDQGTLYYNRDWVWNVFDQAIVSRGMLDERGFGYVEGSLRVHAPDEMRDQHRRPRWFRKVRGGSVDEWHMGYSDHFMIHGRLVVVRSGANG